MAILESNTDLDVKGRVLATTVPNSTGSIVTWNSTSKVFGLRTNAEIISDLNLSSNFVPYTGATTNVNLGTRSITSTGGFIGNASTATTLATARTINGTSFNGSANIVTSYWGTARNITIGNTTKSVNGSANVSWSLSEIGASASDHTHSISDITGLQVTLNNKANANGDNLTNLQIWRDNLRIGTLNNLTTTDKTNLVNAINEVNSNSSKRISTAINQGNNWYRIAKGTASGGAGCSFIIIVERSYGNTNNESYTFSVNTAYNGKTTITQLSGTYNSRILSHLRVVNTIADGIHVDIKYNTTGNNTLYVRVLGSGEAVPATIAPEVTTGVTELETTIGIRTTDDIFANKRVGSINGFEISGRTNNDIVLAGGGHRPVSDFALANDYLPLDRTRPAIDVNTHRVSGIIGGGSSSMTNTPPSSYAFSPLLTMQSSTDRWVQLWFDSFGSNKKIHYRGGSNTTWDSWQKIATEEWIQAQGYSTSDTITRLRGTTSGTYTSGDLTLLAGSNVSISQSGSNFTISATNTNTTYTAGNGLTLSGTTFSLPITYSGSGDYIANIVQNTNGLTVTRATLPVFNDAITTISRNGVNIPIVSKNVDIPIFSTSGAGLVPPRVGSVTTKYLREDGTWVTPTNTTYSAGTLALLQAGTNTSNRVWPAKVIADYITSVTPDMSNFLEKDTSNTVTEDFAITDGNFRKMRVGNYGAIRGEIIGFSQVEIGTDDGYAIDYKIGDNGYGFSANIHGIEGNNGTDWRLRSNKNATSLTIMPETGSTERTLVVGATNGSTTEYANTNGIINISSLVNQSTGNFVSKSGVNIIDYTGWTLDAGVRFGVNNVGIFVSGNDSTNPDSDGFKTDFEVNVEESFIGMYNGNTQSGFQIYKGSKGYSRLKAPDNVTTMRVIPIGVRQNGDTFYSDTEGMINLPTSVSNTTFHNNTHNSTAQNQTVTLTNTSYPRVERIFYGASTCGTLTIRKYAPVDGDELIIQGRQCTIVIKKSAIANHTIFTPSSHDLVTSVTLVSVCVTNSLQSVHLRYMSNYQSWVVLSASITNNGYFV